MKNLHGGPTFLLKMIPVSKLNADFLQQQLRKSTEAIREVGGDVQAVICDGNRTNLSFFSKYKVEEGKPWVSVEGKLLLYDIVHLLKNFRNLWLTERNGELEFVIDGETFLARWQDLRD